MEWGWTDLALYGQVVFSEETHVECDEDCEDREEENPRGVEGGNVHEGLGLELTEVPRLPYACSLADRAYWKRISGHWDAEKGSPVLDMWMDNKMVGVGWESKVAHVGTRKLRRQQ